MVVVDKPEWITHDGSPIFSIDVHPDGIRFATAGADHKVKVWNMGPVLSEGAEGDEKASPRILATLSDHYLPVNVVRWSPDGRYFASGSDDKLILVNELKPGGAQAAFGSTDSPNLENWKNIMTMRGHKNNVVDLAWSPDGKMIASCSLDNIVNVWDALTGALIASLAGHSSFVKGVTWDPVGNYLASQSDDKSVIIWKTDGWAMAHRVEGPYSKSVGATFSLRLAWSPDGKHIITTNSFDPPNHTAAVIDRESWKRSHDLVGHTSPVVVVRFNPLPFRPEAGSGGGGRDLCRCVAAGSQDKSITIWINSRTRPILVLRSFFKQSLVDMAWTPDGRTLLACSIDGTIARFTLESHEMAEPATEEEFDQMMRATYGDLKQRNTAIAESADQLELEAAAQAGAGGGAPAPPSRMAAVMMGGAVGVQGHAHAGGGGGAGGAGGGAAPAGAATSPQQESLGADGRRRIVPQPLGAGGGGGASPVPVMGGGGGARRITPVPVAANGGGAARAGVPRVGGAAPGGAGAAAAGAGAAPSPQANGAGGGAAAAGGAKRRLGMGSPPSALAPPPPPKRPAHATPPANVAAAAAGPLLPHPTVLTSLAADAGLSEAIGDDGRQVPEVLEASNSGRGCEVSRLSGHGAKTKAWSDRLPSPAVALAGTPHFAAVAMRDSTLQLYSLGGRRLLPSVVLDAPVCHAATDGAWRLLVVTASGALRMWDLSLMECVLDHSVAPILSGCPHGTYLVSARISRAGHPLAVLSNGQAYAYQTAMKAWVRVADPSFVGSEFYSTLPPAPGGQGEVAELSAQAARARGARGLAGLVAATAREREELTGRHLEALVAAARALGSGREWSQWVAAYARHLTAAADEGRLRELCMDLLGPVGARGGAGAGGKRWEPEVLGVGQRELLRGVVLPAMARNRAVQRLVNEVLDILNEAEAAPPAE